MAEADLVILKRLQSRDLEGLSLLYDKYAPALYGLAMGYCTSEKDAMDLVENTFVSAWKSSMEEIPAHISLLAWLLQLTGKAAIEGNISLCDQLTPEAQATIGKHKDEETTNFFHYTLMSGGSREQLQAILKIPEDALRSKIKEGFKRLKNKLMGGSPSFFRA